VFVLLSFCPSSPGWGKIEDWMILIFLAFSCIPAFALIFLDNDGHD